MILHIVATHDTVAGLYSQPIFVPSIGQAVRSFGDECKRKAENNTLAMHPEDFTLVYIGTYDDHTGVIRTDINSKGEAKDEITRWMPDTIAIGANYRE